MRLEIAQNAEEKIFCCQANFGNHRGREIEQVLIWFWCNFCNKIQDDADDSDKKL